MVSKSSVWKEHFSTTYDGTEVLLLPSSMYNLFINLAMTYLFPIKERTGDDYIRVNNEVNDEIDLAILQHGQALTREKGEMQLNGASSGRDDNQSNMW
jgi:hypothetical protein